MSPGRPDGDARSDEPLLIHSLASYRDLIFPAFARIGARRICEIGSESGGFTRELADWCQGAEAELWTIEPYPAHELRRMAEERPTFQLIEGLSPGALDTVPACDGWVVDGDHNHWTVLREMRAIIERSDREQRPALVVLHDCSWPWARRDLYYAPSELPTEGVHEHSFDLGVTLDGTIAEGGFRGEGQFAVALRDGGPANGVLTGVEDALAERGGWELLVSPLIFGVGFAFPSDAPWAPAVRELVGPFAGSPLLAAVERNRVALYLRVLAQQDMVADQARRHERIVRDYERRLEEASAELGRLRCDQALAPAPADA